MPLVSFVAPKIDITRSVQQEAKFDSQQIDNKRNFIGLFYIKIN